MPSPQKRSKLCDKVLRRARAHASYFLIQPFFHDGITVNDDGQKNVQQDKEINDDVNPKKQLACYVLDTDVVQVADFSHQNDDAR